MTQGSGMDQPSYSLPPVHTTSPWKLLVRPCLAAGSEDLSSVALVLHRFSLNKPGFLVGACIRSSLLSSQWGLELSFSPFEVYPGSPQCHWAALSFHHWYSGQWQSFCPGFLLQPVLVIFFQQAFSFPISPPLTRTESHSELFGPHKGQLEQPTLCLSNSSFSASLMHLLEFRPTLFPASVTTIPTQSSYLHACFPCIQSPNSNQWENFLKKQIWHVHPPQKVHRWFPLPSG